MFVDDKIGEIMNNEGLRLTTIDMPTEEVTYKNKFETHYIFLSTATPYFPKNYIQMHGE